MVADPSLAECFEQLFVSQLPLSKTQMALGTNSAPAIQQQAVFNYCYLLCEPIESEVGECTVLQQVTTIACSPDVGLNATVD